MLKNITLRLKRQYPLVVITLLITTVFMLHTSNKFHWSIIERTENFLYDLRIIFTMPNNVDKSIVIVDIDEKSLSEIGRWPWSRNQLVRLVDELFENYAVSLVGFDIVFPEPDESSGLKILQVLGRDRLAEIDEYKKIVSELESELDYDKQLANSFTDNNVVLGYYFHDENVSSTSTKSGELPEPVFHRDKFKNKNIISRKATGYNANIKILQDAAASAGHFSPWLDNDGVVRRVPLLYEYQGHFYETLSLAMIRRLFEIETINPVFEKSHNTAYPSLEKLELDYLEAIPVDKYIQALVPYRGKQGSYRYLSATDVIHGRIEKSVLEGAVILVGTTAPGLYDLRTTPVQKQYAGVEVHANLISGILNEKIKHSPAWVDAAELLQLLLTGVILSLLLPLLSPLWSAVNSLIISVIVIGINLWLWQSGMVMPLASSLILITFIFVINMSYGFFIERRGKLQIASTFGQYIPPELIDEMNFDPDSYTLDAESREMTVLFSDVRSFTTISEGLTPEELSELMNEYLTPMTKIIHENRGTIDKYIGDAVMAFWGAPIENNEHARYALKTAMEMLERMHALRHEFQERGWPELHIGVGLNTGMMSVGNMGSEFRLSYTVLGDAVNLGSRLEGLTKAYGVELIVSETTKQAVPEYVYRELDLVKVKGKDKPIAIFEPVALEEEISPQEAKELSGLSEALSAYRKQEWQKAEKLFNLLKQESLKNVLYDLYLERIIDFKSNPPGENWDGVFTHKTK
ncbi:MAG: CHASE2 domain-containing protein [Gammaproteobacteria bacterium]|jgi:adenylate cyclase